MCLLSNHNSSVINLTFFVWACFDLPSLIKCVLMFIIIFSLESSSNITASIEEKLTENGQFRVSVDFCSLGKIGQSTTILIHCDEKPPEVIEKALKKIHRVEGEPELSQNPQDYVLKVCYSAIHIFIYLFIYLSIYLSIYSSICLHICVVKYMCVCVVVFSVFIYSALFRHKNYM